MRGKMFQDSCLIKAYQAQDACTSNREADDPSTAFDEFAGAMHEIFPKC
jgi:hypothetical protein